MPSMKQTSVSCGLWTLSQVMLIVSVLGPSAVAGGSIGQLQESGEMTRSIVSSCILLS